MVASPAELHARVRDRESRPRPLSQSIIAGVTGLLDGLVIVGSGLLIYALYVASRDPGKLPLYLAAVSLCSLLLIQALYVAGLYRFAHLIAPARQIARLMMIVGLVFLVLVACAFAFKISEQFSRVWAFGWLLAMMALLAGSRLFIAAVVRRMSLTGRIRRQIVVYGAGEQGDRLIRHIDSLAEPWNEIVGVFDDRAGRVAATVGGHRVLGSLATMLTWVRKNRADEVLVALPWSAEQRLLAISHSLAALPVNVRLSPEFVGADLVHRRLSYQFGVPMVNVMEKPVSGWGALTKAVLDFGLGGLLTVLSLPLMAVIAVAIRVESRGPVLFRQKRYGFNHELIDVFKFRTMYTDRTDLHAEQLTRKDDPRVTRVGAFLRRFSLDELPQLFNVLRGEMSVVGPRPHATRAKAGGRLYEEVVDDYAVRHKVKPGITGWAQVNGWRGNTETEADIVGRVEHDLYYIENWSVLLDLSIILRTAWVVLQGRNSY